jgi:hypothetical protein
MIAVVNGPAIRAQQDVTDAAYSTLRQAYNSSESVLVAGALEDGTTTPTQPTWSPLIIDNERFLDGPECGICAAALGKNLLDRTHCL